MGPVALHVGIDAYTHIFSVAHRVGMNVDTHVMFSATSGLASLTWVETTSAVLSP